MDAVPACMDDGRSARGGGRRVGVPRGVAQPAAAARLRALHRQGAALLNTSPMIAQAQRCSRAASSRTPPARRPTTVRLSSLRASLRRGPLEWRALQARRARPRASHRARACSSPPTPATARSAAWSRRPTRASKSCGRCKMHPSRRGAGRPVCDDVAGVSHSNIGEDVGLHGDSRWRAREREQCRRVAEHFVAALVELRVACQPLGIRIGPAAVVAVGRRAGVASGLRRCAAARQV